MKPRNPIPKKRATKRLVRDRAPRSLQEPEATPPVTRKRIPAKRTKERVRKTVVRLSGVGMEALRREVYERDGGQCQWPGCGKVLPYEGHDLFRAHLAHIVPRSRGGSDTEENTRILCPAHHIGVEHAYGKTGIKPCKKKEGVTLPERQQHGSD